jgi:hypothetical protein
VLSWGRNVFEALGPGFTLLAFGVDEAALQPALEAAAALRVPLALVRDDAGGERARYGMPLVLVRPDQFVAWAGTDAAALPAALRRAAGFEPPSAAKADGVD